MKKKSLLFAIVTTVVVQYSVFGQQPFNKGLYSPMPLQHYSAPKDTSNKDNKLEIFNMIENKFDSLRFGTTIGNQSNSFLPSSNEQPNEFVKNGNQAYSFTNLQPADQLSGFGSYPITTIVKLYLTFYNPSTGGYSYMTCSGAIINPGFVITAGHCIKSNTDPSYVVACTVMPEYNMGSQPFGQTTTTNWYSFTQWTNNGNWDYDMAILSLSSPIGNSTGWLGWGYNANNSFFTSSSNTFHSFGYPGRDDFGNPVFEQGERMYYMNGYMDNWQSTNTMCHNNIGYHGQSGSALYYKDGSNNRYVYGVLSHGNGTTPPYYTCHCRMDASMFNYFSSIIPATSVIENYNSTKQILVYPNPSSDKFKIDFSEIFYKKITLQVFNNIGQLITEKSILQNEPITTIDLTTFSTGVYFIKAIIDEKIINGKICKTE